MLSMTMEELFRCGENFESFVSGGTRSERERYPKNYNRLVIGEEVEARIKAIDKEINFVCAAEVWCPDCQINLTALKKMSEINSNLNISIITMGRGRKFLAEKLEVEVLKVPTIAMFDEKFELLGKFLEQPKIVLEHANPEEIEVGYYKGRYLLDTVNDILEEIECGK